MRFSFLKKCTINKNLKTIFFRHTIASFSAITFERISRMKSQFKMLSYVIAGKLCHIKGVQLVFVKIYFPFTRTFAVYLFSVLQALVATLVCVFVRQCLSDEITNTRSCLNVIEVANEKLLYLDEMRNILSEIFVKNANPSIRGRRQRRFLVVNSPQVTSH